MDNRKKTDILIVGSACAGLYCALHLPKDKQILIITKADVKSSDSFLAQGGICMLRDEEDYEAYFNDTLKAGHFENDKESVDLMLRYSQDVIKDLVSYGVDFQREIDGEFAFTREGGHSRNRILYHKDITGKEITSHLLSQVKQMPNVTILEYTMMLDIISKDNVCYGAVVKQEDGSITLIEAAETVLASGGIGGIYEHSTNYKHLTGDAIAISIKHGVKLWNVNYVQIHPTTLYTKTKEERSFLISESVRGEGAKLYDKNMNRFVNELLPRDILSTEIYKQMELDHTDYVWEDLRTIPQDELESHFPNIVEHCRKMGYDVTKECIPVVPAQHYFMGGIRVDHNSKTSMQGLHAIGETACNGVHGKNRLASNSLLESLVFSKRAAKEIGGSNLYKQTDPIVFENVNLSIYQDTKKLEEEYKALVLGEIARRNEETKSTKPTDMNNSGEKHKVANPLKPTEKIVYVKNSKINVKSEVC
jgi:L-aspartate oxidase